MHAFGLMIYRVNEHCLYSPCVHMLMTGVHRSIRLGWYSGGVNGHQMICCKPSAHIEHIVYVSLQVYRVRSKRSLASIGICKLRHEGGKDVIISAEVFTPCVVVPELCAVKPELFAVKPEL